MPSARQASRDYGYAGAMADLGAGTGLRQKHRPKPDLTSSQSPLHIRPYEAAEWPALWALLEPVFRAVETFPHDPAITEAEARVAWVKHKQAVMVAVDPAGAVVSTYYLSVVAEQCRRQGIGSRLCQHSLRAAAAPPAKSMPWWRPWAATAASPNRR